MSGWAHLFWILLGAALVIASLAVLVAAWTAGGICGGHPLFILALPFGALAIGIGAWMIVRAK